MQEDTNQPEERRLSRADAELLDRLLAGEPLAEVVDADEPGRAEHVSRLRAGEPVDVPVYDMKTHARTGDVRRVEPPDLEQAKREGWIWFGHAAPTHP